MESIFFILSKLKLNYWPDPVDAPELVISVSDSTYHVPVVLLTDPSELVVFTVFGGFTFSIWHACQRVGVFWNWLLSWLQLYLVVE